MTGCTRRAPWRFVHPPLEVGPPLAGNPLVGFGDGTGALLEDVEKCWENYGPGGDDPADPCGTGEGTPEQTVTLPGGVGIPATLITIPKQLWTDAPVVDWINDRNDSEFFELGQHATYHVNNTTNGDWADQPDRNFYSCEVCGLTLAENIELLAVGRDTLLGNYESRWLAESGATASSPAIDWSAAANPLITYAPPFNADDTTGREAAAALGFKAHTSSVFEEGSTIFTPEGSHHEAFDQFGLFHASADLELDPPETPGDTYDLDAYAAYLQENTDDGGLTTWLIEEVEWSGRPCNNEDRLGTCTATGGSNRENNTVYGPRWEAWIQMLEYVRDYPGGVAMTMGQVALAHAYDNAPTVHNPDQADTDADGIGDVIENVTVTTSPAELSRNQPGVLSVTLTNGAATALVDQTVTFAFDADGDGTDEMYSGTTDADGVATASVTATRLVGPASFSARWDGLRGVTATGNGSVTIADAAALALDANPLNGQVTDDVTVGATLTDSDGVGIVGRSVTFTIGLANVAGTTDAGGHATATVTLAGPAGPEPLVAAFAGDESYGSSSASAAFEVLKEDTVLVLTDAVASRKQPAMAVATLTEADEAPLPGQTIQFYVEDKVRGAATFTLIGSAATDDDGVASFQIPARYVTNSPRPIRAVFEADDSFLGVSGDAFTYRR